jgi:hypothetical protein
MISWSNYGGSIHLWVKTKRIIDILDEVQAVTKILLDLSSSFVNCVLASLILVKSVLRTPMS